MKKWFRFGCAVLLGGSALGLAGGPGPAQPVVTTTTGAPALSAAPVEASPPPVVEKQLGKTDFHLVIPSGFMLKATDGPDFLV